MKPDFLPTKLFDRIGRPRLFAALAILPLASCSGATGWVRGQEVDPVTAAARQIAPGVPVFFADSNELSKLPAQQRDDALFAQMRKDDKTGAAESIIRTFKANNITIEHSPIVNGNGTSAALQVGTTGCIVFAQGGLRSDAALHYGDLIFKFTGLRQTERVLPNAKLIRIFALAHELVHCDDPLLRRNLSSVKQNEMNEVALKAESTADDKAVRYVQVAYGLPLAEFIQHVRAIESLVREPSHATQFRLRGEVTPTYEALEQAQKEIAAFWLRMPISPDAKKFIGEDDADTWCIYTAVKSGLARRAFVGVTAQIMAVDYVSAIEFFSPDKANKIFASFVSKNPEFTGNPSVSRPLHVRRSASLGNG